jgi:hypothetical protein
MNVSQSPFPRKIPFNGLADHWRSKYGERVQKIVVDAGLGCPHRDEKRGRGGCTYCDEFGSGSVNARPFFDIRKQVQVAADELIELGKAFKFYAYLQSYTNTFAPPDYLRPLYEASIDHKDVVGISIGTRPDLLPPKTLDLLEEFSDKVDVLLELGVQSFFPSTLDWFNRAHDSSCIYRAIRNLKARGIATVVHLIFGAPSDPEDAHLKSAKIINDLGVDGVKFHNLAVIKNTTLADLYEKKPFPIWSREKYLKTCSEFLEVLDPRVVVHRTHCVVDRKELLLEPWWSCLSEGPRTKDLLIKLMKDKNTWQGKDFKSQTASRMEASLVT